MPPTYSPARLSHQDVVSAPVPGKSQRFLPQLHQELMPFFSPVLGTLFIWVGPGMEKGEMLSSERGLSFSARGIDMCALGAAPWGMTVLYLPAPLPPTPAPI